MNIGAELLGLHALVFRCTMNDIVTKKPLPAIFFWRGNHFIVVYEISSTYIYVADPAKGYIRYSFDEFEQRWYLSGEQMGVIMTFEPIEDSHKKF
ncbi:MAG: hypothetical protein IJ698_03780 [Prevotella sp.]|nr:hypothetical protein [Prevotella sp.]